MGDDSPWIAGQNLTWLDFYFAEQLDLLKTISGGKLLSAAEFPILQTYRDNFIALTNKADATAAAVSPPPVNHQAATEELKAAPLAGSNELSVKEEEEVNIFGDLKRPSGENLFVTKRDRNTSY